MNYALTYDKIIDRARNRVVEGYTEKHHIIPTALGGEDIASNKVNLTAREHYIAHLLLYKMQSEKRPRWQMLKAVVMMEGKQKNSRLFESARIEFSKTNVENFYINTPNAWYY
jgi:hypothetical protein